MTERPRHRAFSPGRLAAITANTLTELVRLKLFQVLLLFALVLIGGSIFLARFSFQQEFLVLKDISLGAMSLFTSLLAILATAQLLPRDQADRTIYTILARPVPRFEYILGKFGGVILLLGLSLLAMAILFFAVLSLREQAASVASQLASARVSISDVNLWSALAAIFLKACLLSAITLLISTFATSNIFTVIVTVLVYFIGHIQATAREFWLQEQGAGWLGRGFLGAVALVFPDLQLFDFSDQIITGHAISGSLFAQTIALGLFYLTVYLLLAIAIFNTREL